MKRSVEQPNLALTVNLFIIRLFQLLCYCLGLEWSQIKRVNFLICN